MIGKTHLRPQKEKNICKREYSSLENNDVKTDF